MHGIYVSELGAWMPTLNGTPPNAVLICISLQSLQSHFVYESVLYSWREKLFGVDILAS
jgi:hypothetical protein